MRKFAHANPEFVIFDRFYKGSHDALGHHENACFPRLPEKRVQNCNAIGKNSDYDFHMVPSGLRFTHSAAPPCFGTSCGSA